MTGDNGSGLVEVLTTFCLLVDEIKNAFFGNRKEAVAAARRLARRALDVSGAGRDAAGNQGVGRIVGNLADMLLHICDGVEKKMESQIPFSTRAVLETSYLLRELRALFETTAEFAKFRDQFVFDLFKEKQVGIEELHKTFIARHETRLMEGICLNDAAVIYLNLLTNISNITRELTKLVFILPVAPPGQAAR
ncbi:MAG: hypothetical protein M0Z41_09740 [Peptococcaceae bacterium]|jgi:hypothetical protein|nr:hypothetical protein [Peptococcaceae bacterium]